MVLDLKEEFVVDKALGAPMPSLSYPDRCYAPILWCHSTWQISVEAAELWGSGAQHPLSVGGGCWLWEGCDRLLYITFFRGRCVYLLGFNLLGDGLRDAAVRSKRP